MIVSRDPFARQEIHKQRVYTKLTCDWCGQNRSTKTGQTYLYKYRLETDGGQSFGIDKLFCCNDCRRAYHH